MGAREETSNEEEKPSLSGFRKKPLLHVVWVIALGYIIFSTTEAGLSAEFEALQAKNDLGEFKVVDTKMSPLTLFGGRNDVDIFVEASNGEIERLGAIVIGSPMFEYYIEIPAMELLKIRF